MSNTKTQLPQAGEELTPSQRFTAVVEKQFQASAGDLQLTDLQKKRIQNYYIKLDMILKAAETKRLAKPESKRDTLAFSWQNVNMEQLAIDVVANSMVGFDPLQANHVHMIPYKNSRTGKFDIGFITGYNGCELKASKYGHDLPNNIIVKLVYSNERFMPIWKDLTNESEGFIHKAAENPFEESQIIGGYYYFDYGKNSPKNRLETMSIKDIDKRKPKYASAEFWGGEVDKWENNQVVGKTKVEGWHKEMCLKTIKRAAYNSIPIDTDKIDVNLARVLQQKEDTGSDTIDQVHEEINENANKKEIGIPEKTETVSEIINDQQPEKVLVGKDLFDSNKTEEVGF